LAEVVAARRAGEQISSRVHAFGSAVARIEPNFTPSKEHGELIVRLARAQQLQASGEGFLPGLAPRNRPAALGDVLS
jgi:hypothetical protein